MPDYWIKNAMSGDTPRHILVDLGYFRAPSTQDRAKRLDALIGPRNFQRCGFNRLICRIPPAKLDTVLAAFPQIVPRSMRPGYSWTTHSWLDPEGVDLKYAN